MSDLRAPKVFISHATEDKVRFVEGLATRLRGRGIDVWYDKWEMLPGDSLVDKIFEEGINGAAAIVVILSPISVSKKWVREELNASLIAKINGKSRLIPVVIEECDIPVSLQSTVWQRINDLSSYDAEFHRIVNAILGRTDKPPLGTASDHMDISRQLEASEYENRRLAIRDQLRTEVAQNQSLLRNYNAKLFEMMPASGQRPPIPVYRFEDFPIPAWPRSVWQTYSAFAPDALNQKELQAVSEIYAQIDSLESIKASYLISLRQEEDVVERRADLRRRNMQLSSMSAGLDLHEKDVKRRKFLVWQEAIQVFKKALGPGNPIA